MPVNIQDLIPSYCQPNTDEASAGRVRLAFRAHVMFFNEVGCALQLDQLVKTSLQHEQLVAFLCETYSRAVFETIFAMHFDRADTGADRVLLDNIREAYGPDIALAVHEEVKLRGVTLNRHALPERTSNTDRYVESADIADASAETRKLRASNGGGE